MKNIKTGMDDELEFLEYWIEIIDNKMKELISCKAKLMKRCEELRKELQNDE